MEEVVLRMSYFFFGLPTDCTQNKCKFLYSEAGCSRKVQPEQSLSLPVLFGVSEQVNFILTSDL